MILRAPGIYSQAPFGRFFNLGMSLEMTELQTEQQTGWLCML